jgi:uncharacterized membrane protein (UPF0127 family)
MKGLQPFKKLEEDEGMYFPYLPNSNVMFHQGTVRFPLDLIFLKDDCVLRIESNTKVGSNDQWYCNECCGVIEVSGGFCTDNDIEIGDRIAMCAVSEQDLKDTEEENARIAMYGESEFESYDDGYCYPTTLHLVSSIADSI